MNKGIAEIVFFGSLKDGFKVYPSSHTIMNKYSAFYNNAERNYKLQITRNGSLITYTYVRYELSTDPVSGRTGSCFGLSVIFENQYFNDIRLFIERIGEQVFTAMVKEQIILAKNEATGIIGFLPIDFISVSEKLDEWIKNISQVITINYAAYLSGLAELEEFPGGKIDCLSDKSPNNVILERLKQKGGLLLSPEFSITRHTEKEQAILEKQELQKKLLLLEKDYNKKLEENKKLATELKLYKKNIKGDWPNLPAEAIKEPLNMAVDSQVIESIEIGHSGTDHYHIFSENQKGKKKSHSDKRHISGKWIIISFFSAAFLVFLVIKAGCGSNELRNDAIAFESVNKKTGQNNCNWQPPFKKWQYKGAGIKDIEILSVYILKSADADDCTDWKLDLRNSIISNNVLAIQEGKIKKTGNITFDFPSNYDFTSGEFFRLK